MTITYNSSGSTVGGTTSTTTTYTTASITPSSGDLVLIAVNGRQTAPNTPTVSVSGSSISNVQTIVANNDYSTIASPVYRFKVFVAQGTGTGAALSIVFGANQLSAVWNVVCLTGPDLTQGTGGIVQSQTNSTDTSSNGSTFTTTLNNPLSASSNAMVGFPCQAAQNAISAVSSGYTESTGGRGNTGSMAIDGQYNLGPSNLNFTTTWNGTGRNACVLVEVADTIQSRYELPGVFDNRDL